MVSPRPRSLAALAVLSMAGLSLFAQTPTPGATPSGGATSGQPAAGAQGRSVLDPDFSPRPPVRPLSAVEEAKRLWLPPGFKLEPVLSDPDIEEPGQIAFDGNGRMFVIELRGYMQDLEATGELDPVSRISRHEDRNNDGIYETHTVFADKLVLPRWVMPLGANSVLTMESGGDDVWKFTDTNGDGVADKKEWVTSGFGRPTNVQLQPSSLTWALDNWMYSTVNQFRARWTPKGIIKEPTAYNGGQWGVTQDNYGTIYFQGGNTAVPTYFQFPPVYGYFNYPEQYEPDLNINWGAPILVADMTGGMNVIRMPDGSNKTGTAAAGNDIYRGDRLPKDMIGDYFYGETVSRIVRRLHPVKSEGLTQVRNVYPLSEFIRSTDPLFRPVDVTTAPDGTMYITDMYRGVIEEREWVGTYSRQKIAQYQLDKVVRRGRIFRLTYDGMPRRMRQPRMLDETAAQLVTHLSDPNGWWRDTAQQLLVLKQDASVVPALKRLALTSTNQLARIHALWTLEGLGSADQVLLRGLMKDPDPRIRIQAIRASETLYKAGDRSFDGDYKLMAKDADTDVMIQAIMTLNILKIADTPTVVRAAMSASAAKGVQLVGTAILNPPAAAGGRGLSPDGFPAFTTEEQAVMQKGESIYSSLCVVCHGPDGRGQPVAGGAPGAVRAPSLATSARVNGHRDYVVSVTLQGVTGPIDGHRYDDVMAPMGSNTDEWVAAVASYVRNAFGTRGAFATTSDVARVRTATATRTAPPTAEEIAATLPHLLIRDSGWKLTASHRPEAVAGALSLESWHSGTPQQPGMWLQVELTRPARLAELQFNSAAQRAPARGTIVPRAPGAGIDSQNFGAPPPPVETVGFPRRYQVTVSMDGVTWSAPVAQGTGTGRSTVISLAPVEAKFVRITQTAAVENGPPLSIQLLRLYEAGQ